VATKKQQRRRQKLKRHDYEDVYVDEEGNVLEADHAEELVGTTTARKADRPKDRPTTRSGRALEPPSWRKTGRRGLLFFPLMLITVMLLGRDLTLIQQVFQTVVLMCFFLPFSYFMDSMMWRSYERRVARSSEKKP
jgi:hypothetical protein